MKHLPFSEYNTGVSPTSPFPEVCFYNIIYQIQTCKVVEKYLDILFLLTVQLKNITVVPLFPSLRLVCFFHQLSDI